MKAKLDLTATIDGLAYSVPAGKEIPARLADYWAMTGKVEKMKRQGLIEVDAVAAFEPTVETVEAVGAEPVAEKTPRKYERKVRE